MIYPIIYRVSTIQGGVGFLPSTVAIFLTGKSSTCGPFSLCYSLQAITLWNTISVGVNIGKKMVKNSYGLWMLMVWKPGWSFDRLMDSVDRIIVDGWNATATLHRQLLWMLGASCNMQYLMEYGYVSNAWYPNLEIAGTAGCLLPQYTPVIW